MPIYLVRWPNLSFAIVRASNRSKLDDILDEVGDPGKCKVTVYRGPLYLDLELDVNYEQEPIHIEDVENCLNSPGVRLSGDGGDTDCEMRREIARWAFPHYANYLAEFEGIGLDGDETEADFARAREACKEALRKELQQEFGD